MTYCLDAKLDSHTYCYLWLVALRSPVLSNWSCTTLYSLLISSLNFWALPVSLYVVP